MTRRKKKVVVVVVVAVMMEKNQMIRKIRKKKVRAVAVNLRMEMKVVKGEKGAGNKERKKKVIKK